VDEGTYAEILNENATSKKIELSGSYTLVAKRDSDGAWKIAELAWTGGPGTPH
jgi:ketosteroid isomerase-like protein